MATAGICTCSGLHVHWYLSLQVSTSPWKKNSKRNALFLNLPPFQTTTLISVLYFRTTLLQFLVLWCTPTLKLFRCYFITQFWHRCELWSKYLICRTCDPWQGCCPQLEICCSGRSSPLVWSPGLGSVFSVASGMLLLFLLLLVLSLQLLLMCLVNSYSLFPIYQG